MSTEFIKMIPELQFERFNAHLGELIQTRTPCGMFFGFDYNPNVAAAKVQMLIKNQLNVTCAIVIVDAQADALKNLIGVPIVKLEEFPRLENELKPRTIFIFDSLKDLAFVEYFSKHGVEVLTRSDDGRFFFTMKHLPELYNTYQMLGSDESKKVFRAAIRGRLTGKIFDYRFAPEPQYFLQGFTPTVGDIAIDGGAYDGGTAIAFAKCGAKVFAFEMDANNYINCQNRLNSSGGVMI